MTEADWLAGSEPEPMLDFLLGRDDARPGWFAWLGRKRPEPAEPPYRASDRKLRLLACACCRRIGNLLQDERSQKAVEVSEQFADGLADARMLEAARAGAEQALHALPESPLVGPVGVLFLGRNSSARIWSWAARAAVEAARGDAEATLKAMVNAAMEVAGEWQHAKWAVKVAGAVARVRLLREIFGNPFREEPAAPELLAWQNGTVPRLARAIYEDRAFDQLPILADALEEAGCTDIDLLDHCRQEGEHVPGCWALDRLLGRS